MNSNGPVWKVLGLLVGLLTAATPLYVAYDLWGRGAAPEKHVELQRLSPINPMRDLSALGERVRLSLKVENQTINNLVIAQGYLRNIGRTPIVPGDFTEKLSVSVSSPWKIVAVENSKDFSSAVQLRWKRLDDTRFEADAVLLNPGDLVVTYVYATNTKFSELTAGQVAPEPQIEWKARIVNLRSFYEPPSHLDKIASRHFGISLQLSGWALPFAICAALLFQTVYLHLLSRAGFLRGWGAHTIGLVLGASLLSFAAAESSATYLFGNSLTDLLGVDHKVNAPPIILHVLVLAFLYQRSQTKRRAV